METIGEHYVKVNKQFQGSQYDVQLQKRELKDAQAFCSWNQ